MYQYNGSVSRQVVEIIENASLCVVAFLRLVIPRSEGLRHAIELKRKALRSRCVLAFTCSLKLLLGSFCGA